MASLLARMNMTPGTAGPVRRTKSASQRPTPYARTAANEKGNVEGQWKHDMYNNHNDLSARIAGPGQKSGGFSGGALAGKAFSEAFGTGSRNSDRDIQINGAASLKKFNAVEVSGLTPGTTAEDVKTIFQRCGAIVEARVAKTLQDNVVIRLTFKDHAHADVAVQKFDGQHADGRQLSVAKVGLRATAQTLSTRLGGSDGLDVVKSSGDLDVLMDSYKDTGSKMRSDAVLKETGAKPMVAPPGANPADYIVQPTRAGRGRGRGGRANESAGRGRGGGGRRNLSSRMDLD